MVESIIPDDTIITEILPRLPAKSLLRFKSVCKTWNKLISDPLFINQQFNSSLEREAMHITLVFNTSPLTIYSIDPENLDTTVPDDISAYPPPFTSFNPEIGACDGLVCTRVNYDLNTVSVWHASTRTSMTFAFPFDPFPRHSSYGFFYDSTSRDYKVASVRYDKEFFSSEITVHSAGYDEFTLTGFAHYKMIPKKAGVVVNGSIHWMAYDSLQDHSFPEQLIFVLNPTCQDRNKSFDLIPIPTNKRDGLDEVNLAQLGGSLSVVFSYNQRIEVWLMKEYGVVESWSMYFEIPTDDLYFMNRPLKVVPLYITKKGNLILQINYRKLFMYDPTQKSLKSIKVKYPKTGLHLTGNTDNLPFYAMTLLHSLVDIRNCYARGRPFLGRQIKREWNLYNCTGKRIIESMGSDYASDSPVSEYRKMFGARFVEVVFSTSDLKLYKLLKECKMDLRAATEKFTEQVLGLLFSEFKPYLEREFGITLPQISEDATAENLRTDNTESDSASIRQMQIENESVSSTPERLNHVAVPIPEFGPSMSNAPPKQQSPEYRFYQLTRNTQLDWIHHGHVAARLAILRGSSKFVPHLKAEIETTLERFARYVNASSDSAKGVGDSDSSVASKLSVMDTNGASVSSAAERVNYEVCGLTHYENQRLLELGEGQ